MRWSHLAEFDCLPEDWELVPFPMAVDIIAGQSPPSESYNQRGKGLPFLQGNADFGEVFPTPTVWCEKPNKKCQAGATLISVRAPVGELNRADQEYAIGRGLAAIQARDINPDFLHYGMFRWRKSLERAGQGSTYDAITARHLKQISIPRPKDPNEQREIAKIINAADEALDRMQQNLQAARRLKTALLQQLFTKGIPGRHRKFVETKIGRIPAEWETIEMQAIAHVDSGITLNKERVPTKNPVQYLTVVNVQRERIDLKEIRYLEVKESEVPDKLLATGDILVVEGHANSAEIGRAAIVTKEAEGMTYQNHLFRVRLKESVSFNEHFLLGCLNSERVRRHWNATANTSSGLNTINRRGLRKLLIPKPSDEEQLQIEQFLESANEYIFFCERRHGAAERLKKSLLQNLLTGKVRLKKEVLK